MKELSQTQQN